MQKTNEELKERQEKAEVLLLQVFFSYLAEKAINPTLVYSSVHEDISKFLQEGISHE